jgi:hypothetical protein
MRQKNLILDEEGERFSELLGPACDCLAADGPRALAKDFHLVQSALASGQTVISNEKHFPELVATACLTVRELGSLFYANPDVEGDACRLWIKAGAQKDMNRRIDVWVEDHLRSG